MHAILTDIEGTTTRISSVRDVLFPFARRRLAEFVLERHGDPEVTAILEEVRRHEGDPSLSEAHVVACLLRWSDADQKVTPLKTLQGLIWAEGYARGDLRGHVYDDALASMRAWRARGLPLYVYSSGSIAAQKLLFRHAEAGDLTGLFSGFFDTTIGSKLAAPSYEAIAQSIGASARDILFLSDHLGELDAARTAGLATTWLDRDASPELSGGHPRVSTFADIRVE
jgi:enolase-phosphatase E1